MRKAKGMLKDDRGTSRDFGNDERISKNGEDNEKQQDKL
jgi:hypothetical protein